MPASIEQEIEQMAEEMAKSHTATTSDYEYLADIVKSMSPGQLKAVVPNLTKSQKVLLSEVLEDMVKGAAPTTEPESNMEPTSKEDKAKKKGSHDDEDEAIKKESLASHKQQGDNSPEGFEGQVIKGEEPGDKKEDSAKKKLAEAVDTIAESEAEEAKEEHEKEMHKAAPKGVDEEKYKRCKEDVKEQSPGVNEYAVCAASLQGKTKRPEMKKSFQETMKSMVAQGIEKSVGCGLLCKAFGIPEKSEQVAQVWETFTKSMESGVKEESQVEPPKDLKDKKKGTSPQPLSGESQETADEAVGSAAKENIGKAAKMQVDTKEMAEEHKKLVDVLESPSHKDDKKEAKKQKKELVEYEEKMKKGGEGSKGGKVIGHTRSGKPIYDQFNNPAHKDFTAEDHESASTAHQKEFHKLNPAFQKESLSNKMGKQHLDAAKQMTDKKLNMKKSQLQVTIERMQDRKLEKDKCIEAICKSVEGVSPEALSTVWDALADQRTNADLAKAFKPAQDPFSVRTIPGNCHYDVDAYLESEEIAKSERISKGETFNYAVEEEKSLNVNDFIEKGLDMDQDTITLAKSNKEAKPSGAFTTSSFSEEDMEKACSGDGMMNGNMTLKKEKKEALKKDGEITTPAPAPEPDTPDSDLVVIPPAVVS